MHHFRLTTGVFLTPWFTTGFLHPMFRITSSVVIQDRLRVSVVHKQLVDFCMLVYNQSRAFFPLRSPERRSCVPDWLSFSCSFLARSKLWGSWETRKRRRWKDKCKEVRERYQKKEGGGTRWRETWFFKSKSSHFEAFDNFCVRLSKHTGGHMQSRLRKWKIPHDCDVCK